MDRISALRNVEEALSAFEAGELTLPELEREVRGVVRTYATAFDDRRPYRASGDPAVEGLVVLARSPAGARERVDALVEDPARIEVDPLE